ncbi:hypothetical protein phi1p003 [Escherichia phage Phi1]|uniref:Uncharacterized protein n=1 Tax=Escherichia phage Phi1 TaxID=448384 RepID=A7XEU1_9CAUD|nr:hypothetical protein phi1p003 [Escherichia phage Phi1]ABR24511.1 hypothetical protein phi1p003 [Escherichia phage Phi1]
MRNHYIELASRKVSDLKGVIAYYEEVLKNEIADWERKEYSKFLEKSRAELVDAEAHLQWVIENV